MIALINRLIEKYHNRLLDAIDARGNLVHHAIRSYRKQGLHLLDGGPNLTQVNRVEDDFLRLMQDNMTISTSREIRNLDHKMKCLLRHHKATLLRVYHALDMRDMQEHAVKAWG